jgi:nitrogenase subunit NifH
VIALITHNKIINMVNKRKNIRKSKEEYKTLGRKSIYINPKNNTLKTYRSNNHKLLDMINKLIQNKNKINPTKLTEKQRKEAIDKINELLFI